MEVVFFSFPSLQHTSDICSNFSSEGKKKKKKGKFPGSRHIIRKKAGKSKTGLLYNDVFTETWKAEICIGYQRETNVCYWNIWVSFILRNMALHSTHLKIGVDTVNVSLGFEVKKLFFPGILWLYWTETMSPVNKPYISEFNFIRCIIYSAESFMFTHRFVCTEIHWCSGVGKVMIMFFKKAWQFPDIQNWSVIHYAYQT